MLNLTYRLPNNPTMYSKYFDTDAEIDAFIQANPGIKLIVRDSSARAMGAKYFS